MSQLMQCSVLFLLLSNLVFSVLTVEEVSSLKSTLENNDEGNDTEGSNEGVKFKMYPWSSGCCSGGTGCCSGGTGCCSGGAYMPQGIPYIQPGNSYGQQASYYYPQSGAYPYPYGYYSQQYPTQYIPQSYYPSYPSNNMPYYNPYSQYSYPSYPSYYPSSGSPSGGLVSDDFAEVPYVIGTSLIRQPTSPQNPQNIPNKSEVVITSSRSRSYPGYPYYPGGAPLPGRSRNDPYARIPTEIIDVEDMDFRNGIIGSKPKVNVDSHTLSSSNEPIIKTVSNVVPMKSIHTTITKVVQPDDNGTTDVRLTYVNGEQVDEEPTGSDVTNDSNTVAVNNKNNKQAEDEEDEKPKDTTSWFKFK